MSPHAWLACHQSREMVSWRDWAEEARSLLAVSLQVGLGPHSDVPGALWDIPPQWQPLPGQLWPSLKPPASPATQSSSLRPDKPMRVSVFAQRLRLEKLGLSQTHS